jgi:L-arabinose isomerase
MYTIDFSMDAIIFCHAGEGNFATARKDVPVKLIDRYLGEGGLDNPPTHIFTPEPGEYTLYSLVSQSDGKFRIIAAKGDVLPRNDMVNCEMPYFFWKPQSGVKNCIGGWLKNGGPHHEIIQKGDITKSLQMLCDMLGIGYTEV